MSTVTITITDSPHGVIARVESDPPMPIDSNGDPDVDNMTDAQAAAILMAETLVEAGSPNSEFRTMSKVAPEALAKYEESADRLIGSATVTDRERDAVIHVVAHRLSHGDHSPTSCPLHTRAMCQYEHEIRRLAQIGIHP